MSRFSDVYLDYCSKVGPFFKSRASDELVSSLQFLKWKIEPENIVGASIFSLAALFVILTLFVGFLVFWGINFPFLLFAPLLSLLAFFFVSEWPKYHAHRVAVSSLGFAPQIVAQIAVPLKINPSLEGALTFVAKNGEGKIAEDFRDSMWDVWTGKTKDSFSVLDKVSGFWSKFSSGFQRSMYLIRSSFHEKDRIKRNESLDKSVEVILEDIVSKMRDYALAMHMPTLILFSLGIIVPLMVISLFPVVAFFGVNISPFVIGGFLFFSLFLTLIYSEFIIRKRPATFSAHKIKGDVPEGYLKIHKWVFPAVSLSLILFILLGSPGIFFLLGGFKFGSEGLNTLLSFLSVVSVVWAVGISISVYFFGTSWHKKVKRDEIRESEEQFMDSMYHIHSRLSDGRPIEDALEFSVSMMPDMRISEIIGRILNNMKKMSLPLDKSVDEAKIESPTIRSVFKLIEASLESGVAAAAQTTMVISDYLSKMRTVEKDLISMLSRNMSMMKATAIFFAPVVCAVIVVLFQMISGSVTSASEKFSTLGYDFLGFGIVSAPTISVELLTLLVGIYAIGLNLVLVRYIARIQWGFDDVAVGLELSKSIPAMLLVFTIALSAARMFLLR